MWSYFFIGVMIYQNPSQVGVGCGIAFVLGFLIYYLFVPKDDSQRSMVVDEVGAEPVLADGIQPVI